MHWPALWGALVAEGILVHLVWILQCIYFGQCGEVVGDMGQSGRIFFTAARVCAKSTFVLCGVAMGDARMEGRGRNKYRLQLDGRWS